MRIKPRKFSTPLKIAATYIGTVVGAGFASGQEVLKFFAYFGYKGIIGGLITTFLFAVLGTFIMYLGFKINASSYEDLLIYVMGKKLGRIVDLILTIFLFSTLGIMLAGSGAIFSEHLALPKNLGIVVTTFLAILTLLYGLKGIMNVNSLFVPLMTILVLLISTYSLSQHGIHWEPLKIYEPQKAASPHWFLSVLLYVGYNLILTTAILAPMGAQIADSKELIIGGLLGGIGLGFLIILMTVIVINHFPEIGSYEVPMLYITNTYYLPIKLFFAGVLWAEIFSTIIGNVFGFTARVASLLKTNPNRVMIITMILAVIFSQLGFSFLVGIIYPLLGYLSLVFLLALTLKAIKKESRRL